MDGLQFGKYTFTCRLNDPAVLPAYKGSTFRGVFGVALKKVVCALRQQECIQCPLRQRCLYTQVFETPLAIEPPKGLRVSVAPHPFVIQPVRSSQQEYSAGDALACDLLLFGKVNASLPYFIYAFEQMGRIGIGRRVNGRRAGFILYSVKSDDKLIFSAGKQTIHQDHPVTTLSVPEKAEHADEVFQVLVTLETPLRLKFKNRIKADLPFHVLVRAMLRRISALFTCYVGAEPMLDYKGMLERAKEVKIVKSHIRWHAWERYSNRQKQRMPLGGIVGSVTYKGQLGEFLPLLDVGSKLHIGKNTSFGLGKLSFSLI